MSSAAHRSNDVLVAMKAARVTQAQVARSLGCTEAFVWQVIDGRRSTARVQDAIAAAVGLPVAELFPARAVASAPDPSSGAEPATAA